MCQKTGMLHLITLLYLHQGFRSHSHFDYANLITLFLSNMPQQRDNELLSGDQIKCNRISCFCLSGADFKGCEGASCLSKRGKGKFKSTEKIFKRQCLYSRGDGKHPCCAKWAWEQRGKRTNTQPFGIHPQIFSCTQLKDSRCCSWATCSVSNKSKNNEGIILWYLYCNHKHQCTQALLLWHQSCCVRKSNVVVRSSTTLCTPKPSKVPWCKLFQQQPHLF